MSTVSARELVALVYNSDFAVSTSKSDWAGAGVVLASVEACGSVMTGTIIGTEVQILVTHLTTPTLLAVTGPGLRTCSVNTSRVDFAFVTKMSLPAFMTFAFSRLSAVTIGLATSRGTFGFETVIITCEILIVLFPSIETNFFSIWATCIMTKVIISRLADNVAVSSIVGVSTD
jgi:hypothetical protein